MLTCSEAPRKTNSKWKNQFRYLPRLRIATRKTPSGEGWKTWEGFQMRSHKGLIDLHNNMKLEINHRKKMVENTNT